VIRHIVLFKLKVGVTSDDLDRWLEMSRRAHTRIESVHAFSIGTDLMHLPRSYDVAVVADFDSLDDIRAYAEDPEHLPVIELSRELSEHIASVDFEV
jgi:Stress responsive A/B Barrel Domain